jgi:TldD protein
VLEQGRVTRAAHAVDHGAGVRTVQGDRVGFASTEELTPRALAEVAAAAARVSGTGAPGPTRPLRRREVRDLSPEGQPFDAAPTSTRVDLLTRLDERLRRLDPRIASVTLSLTDERSQVRIATSEGRLVDDVRPGATLRASCVGVAGQRRELAMLGFGVRAGLEAFDDARLDLLAANLVGQLGLLFDARRPPAGEFPVVLSAGSSGILLHEAIGHGLEADFNRKNVSIFADRLGTPVASPDVTLVDSGLLPHKHGALNVDDEGEPSAETVLVERGVLRSYLHDRISAAHYGVASTGSARRQSFRHVPLPRMRCTYMLAGPRERDEVVASVRCGLLATTFGNGQVQIGAGDFSFYVRVGWWIEDGRLAYPVKDVNLIGNGPDVLATIDLVGNDLVQDDGAWTCGKDGQGVPVSLGMPTVRVPSLVVGGVTA